MAFSYSHELPFSCIHFLPRILDRYLLHVHFSSRANGRLLLHAMRVPLPASPRHNLRSWQCSWSASGGGRSLACPDVPRTKRARRPAARCAPGRLRGRVARCGRDGDSRWRRECFSQRDIRKAGLFQFRPHPKSGAIALERAAGRNCSRLGHAPSGSAGPRGPGAVALGACGWRARAPPARIGDAGRARSGDEVTPHSAKTHTRLTAHSEASSPHTLPLDRD